MTAFHSNELGITKTQIFRERLHRDKPHQYSDKAAVTHTTQTKTKYQYISNRNNSLRVFFLLSQFYWALFFGRFFSTGNFFQNWNTKNLKNTLYINCINQLHMAYAISYANEFEHYSTQRHLAVKLFIRIAQRRSFFAFPCKASLERYCIRSEVMENSMLHATETSFIRSAAFGLSLVS